MIYFALTEFEALTLLAVIDRVNAATPERPPVAAGLRARLRDAAERLAAKAAEVNARRPEGRNDNANH